MLRTCLYLFGVLALINTDLSHTSQFYALFLPLCDVVFLIFIILELQLFFTGISFGENEYSVYDLATDLFDLPNDIAELGFFRAVTTLAFSLLDALLLFTAVFYAFDILLDM